MQRNELAHLIRNFCARCASSVLTLEKEFCKIMYPSDRDFFLDYAWRFLGTPYIWGGDDPMRGFDCSGFVIEGLKAIGKLPYAGDWTAQALWLLFKDRQVDWPGPGALVFWQNKSKGIMTHIEICVHPGISLGAGGGGSNTLTVQDAIDQNAFIRARPFQGRDNRELFYADPFKEV